MGQVNLVAGGWFSKAGAIDVNGIARWNAITGGWQPLATGMAGGDAPSVEALAWIPNGDLIAGGNFSSAGGKPAKFIARWDGTAWWPLGAGTSAWVLGLAVLSDGDLAVGGLFTLAGGLPANHTAKWSVATGSWNALGMGTDAPTYKLRALPDGGLVVGGIFGSAGQQPAERIARWGCPPPTCYTDCDQNLKLNIDDFVCFQTMYAVGDPKADCDGNGVLEINDFICFQTAFAVGC